MPRRAGLLAGLAVAMLASTAAAQGFLRLRTACMDSAVTQAAMDGCTETDLLTARERLTHLLATLRQTLPTTHFTGLDSAQVAWRAYVQLECDWEASAYRGGTLEAMMRASCLEASTWHRIRELAPLLCGLERAEPRCRAAEPFLKQARTLLSRP